MNRDDKRRFVILTIILSILLLILSSYLIYDKVLRKDNDEINRNKEYLIDIEDAELVASFKEQIYNLEYLDNISVDGNSNLKNGWFYELDNLLISEMDDDKLLMYAVNMEADKIFSASTNKGLPDGYQYNIVYYDSLKSILMSSGYINNEEILTNLDKIDSCPKILYNSEYDGYIITGSCGYELYLKTYDYKLEKNEEINEYYLYRSVAYMEGTPDYTNITKLIDKEINQNNYNNYSKYKFTFKDKFLYSVEKVK